MITSTPLKTARKRNPPRRQPEGSLDAMTTRESGGRLRQKRKSPLAQHKRRERDPRTINPYLHQGESENIVGDWVTRNERAVREIAMFLSRNIP